MPGGNRLDVAPYMLPMQLTALVNFFEETPFPSQIGAGLGKVDKGGGYANENA